MMQELAQKKENFKKSVSIVKIDMTCGATKLETVLSEYQLRLMNLQVIILPL